MSERVCFADWWEERLRSANKARIGADVLAVIRELAGQAWQVGEASGLRQADHHLRSLQTEMRHRQKMVRMRKELRRLNQIRAATNRGMEQIGRAYITGLQDYARIQQAAPAAGEDQKP